MPSANTVAQKPAGNVNPLSSFEHAVLLDFLGGSTWFCAHTGEATADNVANAMMTNKRGLFELNNRIEPSRDGNVTRRGHWYAFPLTETRGTVPPSKYCVLVDRRDRRISACAGQPRSKVGDGVDHRVKPSAGRTGATPILRHEAHDGGCFVRPYISSHAS